MIPVDPTGPLLSSKVSHALKWSLLGELSSRLITPIVFLVLARLLTPEDFGVAAAAALVISFSQAIVDAGLGKALVQRQSRVHECANTAFWGNLTIGVAVMILLIAAAPVIAGFFGDERIIDVTRVLALQVPLAALCTVPTALLQRDLAFSKLFWVRLLTAGLPALVSVPMALNGLGYWALVAGALASQALQAIVLWRSSFWRPYFGFDRRLARELVNFGRWALLSGLLAWFYVWMDSLIVARYLGAHEMGLYRTGNMVVIMIFGLVFAPMLPVLYSLLSRLGNDPSAVGRALGEVAAAMVVVSLPIAALVVLMSPGFEVLVFGKNWAGLAPILALLAASQGLAWLVGANGEAYRAIGRPELETWAMGLSTVVYLVAYLISIHHGLYAFVATRAALVLVGISIQVAIARRALGLGPVTWTHALLKPALFALLAFTLARACEFGKMESWQNLIGQAVVLVVTYTALVAMFDRGRLGLFKRVLNAA